MGFYIGDDRTQLKIPLILSLGGKEFDYEKTYWEMIPKGMVPVIVVRNKFFEAAGIAFCREEYERFTDPMDIRPRKGYYLPREVVIRECPSIARYL